MWNYDDIHIMLPLMDNNTFVISTKEEIKMNAQQMQALSCKELEYISDCISNEDMQIKLCSTIAATTQNQAIRQTCQQQVQTHEQNLQTLTDCLRQHEQLAPAQLQ